MNDVFCGGDLFLFSQQSAVLWFVFLHEDEDGYEYTLIAFKETSEEDYETSREIKRSRWYKSKKIWKIRYFRQRVVFTNLHTHNKRILDFVGKYIYRENDRLYDAQHYQKLNKIAEESVEFKEYVEYYEAYMDLLIVKGATKGENHITTEF